MKMQGIYVYIYINPSADGMFRLTVLISIYPAARARRYVHVSSIQWHNLYASNRCKQPCGPPPPPPPPPHTHTHTHTHTPLPWPMCDTAQMVPPHYLTHGSWPNGWHAGHRCGWLKSLFRGYEIQKSCERNPGSKPSRWNSSLIARIGR